MQDLKSANWHGQPAAHVWSLWTRYACTAFYAHPFAWTEIGFPGPAYPRGVALLDLIPVIGSTVGGAVVSLVALTVSLPVALATLAFYIAYRLAEDYLIVPRIMGRTVQVPAIVSLIAVLIGGAARHHRRVRRDPGRRGHTAAAARDRYSSARQELSRSVATPTRS